MTMSLRRTHATPALVLAAALACAVPAPADAAGARYGDVAYADPGYQPDGRERYPIDTPSHIRAAWAYVNRSRNAGRYTPEQLEAVRARIIAAWKAKIDPQGPPSARNP